MTEVQLRSGHQHFEPATFEKEHLRNLRDGQSRSLQGTAPLLASSFSAVLCDLGVLCGENAKPRRTREPMTIASKPGRSVSFHHVEASGLAGRRLCRFFLNAKGAKDAEDRRGKMDHPPTLAGPIRILSHETLASSNSCFLEEPCAGRLCMPCLLR